MIESFDEGFEEGIEKGIEKGSERVVVILRELRRKEKTIEQIAQAFNVKIDFVETLNDLL
jgi:predicted transposase YdaD